MARYRKRPIEVEAQQWFPGREIRGVFSEESWATLHSRVSDASSQRFRQPDLFYVVTIHGQRAYLSPGDWVITESDGIHHYPCKSDEFERIYEPVPE